MGHIVLKNIPYQTYKKRDGAGMFEVDNKKWLRIWNRIGELMEQGATVNLNHRIKGKAATLRNGDPYDVVDIEITW